MTKIIRCKKCKKKAIDKNHHKYCDNCWKEIQWNKGNLTVYNPKWRTAKY